MKVRSFRRRQLLGGPDAVASQQLQHQASGLWTFECSCSGSYGGSRARAKNNRRQQQEQLQQPQPEQCVRDTVRASKKQYKTITSTSQHIIDRASGLWTFESQHQASGLCTVEQVDTNINHTNTQSEDGYIVEKHTHTHINSSYACVRSLFKVKGSACQHLQGDRETMNYELSPDPRTMPTYVTVRHTELNLQNCTNVMVIMAEGTAGNVVTTGPTAPPAITPKLVPKSKFAKAAKVGGKAVPKVAKAVPGPWGKAPSAPRVVKAKAKAPPAPKVANACRCTYACRCPAPKVAKACRCTYACRCRCILCAKVKAPPAKWVPVPALSLALPGPAAPVLPIAVPKPNVLMPLAPPPPAPKPHGTNCWCAMTAPRLCFWCAYYQNQSH